MELIKIEEWKRKNYFYYYLNRNNPTISCTINLDCTNIYNISKREKVPFIVTFMHALLSFINHFEQFRIRHISDEYIARYDRIDIAYIELNGNHNFINMITKYKESLKDFYEIFKENRKKRDSILHISNEKFLIPINTILFSALTKLDLLSFQSSYKDPYVGKGCIKIKSGKLNFKDNIATISLAVDFAHSFYDGYDFSLFVEYLINDYGKEN